MADTVVQLPPNSSGIALRVISGDQTNLIPAGVTEEVVIPSDAQGLFAGDVRQAPLAVADTTLGAILEELRQIRLLLELKG